MSIRRGAYLRRDSRELEEILSAEREREDSNAVVAVNVFMLAVVFLCFVVVIVSGILGWY
jgi:predicted nucleic acid-binding Zn ribbon protein